MFWAYLTWSGRAPGGGQIINLVFRREAVIDALLPPDFGRGIAAVCAFKLRLPIPVARTF
jgi:hypothetical protein